MTQPKIDRIERAIRNIQTSTDVDPWADKIAVEAMQKQIDHIAESGRMVSNSRAHENDVIFREAAIDALAMMMPRSYTPDGSHPADEEIFRAQEVFADCIEALEILPPAQPELHWIPCSKRLPEDGRCLVTRFDFVTNTCFLDILWYEKGVWWNRLYIGDFAVIAWMPLPEPYRGGEKDDR